MSKKKKPKKLEKKTTQEIPVKAGIKTRTIQVDYLARVEGEGALFIDLVGDKVKDVRLKIFEPPRFFEAFMRGRDYKESPDITARICGICPVAYQMSAVTALENALKLTVSEDIQQLRRLMYCGEWIESHSLHVYMLHAPDFLGFQDAIEMSKFHPQLVKDGLSIKKAGNHLIRLLGGREIHPINVRVGGFYKIPLKVEFSKLKEELLQARDKAYVAVKSFASFDFPDFHKDYECVALSHESEYPMARGHLVSNKGLNIAAKDFENSIEEFQVKHSTALHTRLKERSNYHVGPIARYNHNRNRLSKLALQAAEEVKLETYCTNPFRSILIRSIEILYAFDEAIRIIDNLDDIRIPFVESEPFTSTGYGITEAPRGILYHRYKMDQDGSLTDIRIVAPTSQNQNTIEKDLKEFVEKNIHLPQEELTHRCEQLIRNYDPCISCSAHFLKVYYQHDLD